MIKALIVGLGWWGQTLVNSVHKKSEKINICYGLTRTSSVAANDYTKSRNIELLDGIYEDVVQQGDIDAVILATPHSQHSQQVKIAAKYGKHVACEKPFTLKRSEAIEAIEEVEKNNVTLSILYNRRFNPVVKEIQKLVKTGALGTIIHIESNFSGDTALKVKTDKTSWRQDPNESPLGSMTSRGLHVVDTLVSLCGEIDNVFATTGSRVLGDLDDMTSCLIKFRDGMTGYVGTSNVTSPFWWIKVYGSEATAEMRDYNTLIIHSRNKLTPKTLTFNNIDVEKSELESFADNIKNGVKFSIPKNEIINVSSFLEAAILSCRSKTQIVIDNNIREF